MFLMRICRKRIIKCDMRASNKNQFMILVNEIRNGKNVKLQKQLETVFLAKQTKIPFSTVCCFTICCSDYFRSHKSHPMIQGRKKKENDENNVIEVETKKAGDYACSI